MNLGKIWQKAKDLYGWDQGNLYWNKSNREMFRGKVEYYKAKVAKAQGQKEFDKYNYHLQKNLEQFNYFDSQVKEHDRSDEFDTKNIGWRKERKD
jgi:hypothetical protein